MPSYNKFTEFKQKCEGRWPEILSRLGGISPEILDGKNHPCPKCGGKDRFRLIDAAKGALFCNKCFKSGNGDGIAALGWILNIRPLEVANMIEAYLGTGSAYVPEKAPPKANRPLGTEVATYRYEDEKGELLYQVVRFEPKDFRQRRPKASGGWDYSLGEVRRVLYRLPQLLAVDPAEIVFLVEGEKDANRLSQLGLVATCNAGGAGKWLETYSESLTNRRVVVLPDNDEAGENHAGLVLPSISKQASEVKVLRLPGLPTKGDVSDWLNAGGTKERLLELVSETEVWEPVEAQQVTGKGEEQPWPEIQSLEQEELPEFPLDALPAIARQYVTELSQFTQTPPEMAGLLVLAVCGACIARWVVVEVNGWKEPVNLFVAVLMEPASRKSAVFAEVIKPLEAIENELIEQAKPEIARWMAKREIDLLKLKELKKEAAEPGGSEAHAQAMELAVELDADPQPIPPLLITDDSTTEQLERILAQQNGRIASMSAEGGVFDILAGKYSGNSCPSFDVFLKGHSGDQIRTDRVGRESVRVENPALTCGYAIQPVVVQGMAKNKAMRGRGLWARFLYSMPSGNVGYRELEPAPVSQVTTKAFAEQVRRMFSIQENYVLGLDSPAAEVFLNWRGEIELDLRPDGKLDSIKDWGGKLAGATLRIAGILHCMKHSPQLPIGGATIRNAIEIARYLIPHCLAVFGMMGAADDPSLDDARYLLRWILRHGHERFTKSKAQQDGKRRFKLADDIEPGLAELEKRGYIRPIPKEGNQLGRPPSPEYAVNPAVFDSQRPENRPEYPSKSVESDTNGSFQDIQSAFGQDENENSQPPADPWGEV